MFFLLKYFFSWTVVVLFFVVFAFFGIDSAFAEDSVYFEDDFNSSSLDGSKWYSQNSGGDVRTEGGYLKLTSDSSKHFPIVRNKIPAIPPDGDYSVEIKFRYPQITNWGTGIVLGNTALTYETTLDGTVTNQFTIWQSLNDNLLLQTYHCLSNNSCDGVYTSLKVYSQSTSDHTYKLMFSDNKFNIYFDGLEVANAALQNTSRRSEFITFGNMTVLQSDLNWTDLWIDYVRVTGSEQKKPVIVVPGLGGSWDFGAILKGEAGTDWKVPSFIDLYDNLTNSLVNAGYEKDKNLFVFGYDWRKGLNDLSGDLDNYVKGLVSQGKIGVTDKIDFIGHSYGGLVARTYGQKIGTDKIDKIVTAGSPHQGNIDAYGLWEGATVWKNVWWQRAALELMIKLNQKSGENRVAVVRRLAPGTKDALPTFDFLKKDDTLLFSNSLLQKNLTLNDLNSNMATIADLLWANGGNNSQTDRFLKVVDRGWLEKTQGQWEDGKPTASPFETITEGDGAVLSLSAVSSFVNQSLIGANHEEIIGKTAGIEKIFEQLGLDKTKVVANITPDSRKRVFIASLRSPGTLHVCDQADVCDGSLGVYLPEEKLFFYPGYDEQTLTTTVRADGETGQYELYVGDMDEDQTKWKEERGNLITSNQIDTYQVVSGAGGFGVTGDTQTSSRSFDEDLSILNGLIPNWDKKNLMTVARSGAQPKSKRIMAIRQLRELLSRLAIKAYKNNITDQIEAIIDVWKDLDNLAEAVIGSDNSTKTAFLNANILQVEAYKTLADNLLENSSSYYAGTFYTLFTERFAQAKELKTSKRDLSLDKTLSSRYLLLTALGVR